MRLGVFVGSFNPVHEGHMHVVHYLIDKGILDKVLIIPTLPYWDKNNLASIEDRVNMLRFYENENVIIDTVHNVHPYTYQVMRSLEQDYPNDELLLIIGADNIIQFDKWMEYKELLKRRIIVVNRNNIDISKYIEKYEEKDNFIVLQDFDFINISSTNIKEGDGLNNLKPEVYQYIKEHNLYKDDKKNSL